MAVIQPNEIAGLPELFDEVRALRQELELLKAGVRLGRSPGSPIAEPQTLATPIVLEDEEPGATEMSPAEIRQRVGRVVGQEPNTVEPEVAAPKGAGEPASERAT